MDFSRRKRFKTPLLLAACLLLLGACGAVVGAGAGVGVAVVQERGLKQKALDLEIEALILDKFVRSDLKMTAMVGVEVYEGRVLLTGAITNKKMVDQAVRFVWQVTGVTQVINEIQAVPTGIADYAQDTWITVQLKAVLTLDNQVLAINYVIETVNGTVYLIGVAQDREELNRVIAHASRTKFVRRVITHVRIKDGKGKTPGAAGKTAS